MAVIKVHMLNFHSIFCSHIEIVLENVSATPHTYYSINRWDEPDEGFSNRPRYHKNIINEANSTYTFEIEADPEEIAEKWRKYYQETCPQEGILRNNCAVAAQWFLKTFAKIPNPSASSSPVSLNYFTLGFFIPSFIPICVELPGRIMDNAKHHIEERSHAKQPSSVGLFSKRNVAYLTATAAAAVSYIAATNSLGK